MNSEKKTQTFPTIKRGVKFQLWRNPKPADKNKKKKASKQQNQVHIYIHNEYRPIKKSRGNFNHTRAKQILKSLDESPKNVPNSRRHFRTGGRRIRRVEEHNRSCLWLLRPSLL